MAHRHIDICRPLATLCANTLPGKLSDPERPQAAGTSNVDEKPIKAWRRDILMGMAHSGLFLQLL